MDLIVDFPSTPANEPRQMYQEEDDRLFVCKSLDESNGLIVEFGADAPRVAFADHAQVHLIENYSANCEAKRNIWYANSEIKSFMREKNQDVTLIKILQRFGNSNCSTMAQYTRSRLEQANTTPTGLEYKLGIGKLTSAEINARREHYFRAVLDEQERQRERNPLHCNPEAIACIARKESEWAKDRAYMIGALQADIDNSCMSILMAGRRNSIQLVEQERRPSMTSPSA